MLSFTLLTAVTVATLIKGSGTGAIIPGSAEKKNEEGTDLEGEDEVVGSWYCCC